MLDNPEKNIVELFANITEKRGGRDHVVVGFTTTCTCAISAYHH